PVVIRTGWIDAPCAVRRSAERLARTNDTDDAGAIRKSALERGPERSLARKDEAVSIGVARGGRERRGAPFGDAEPVLEVSEARDLGRRRLGFSRRLRHTRFDPVALPFERVGRQRDPAQAVAP